MPFGLTNAPATFQRLMDIVLTGLKWQYCLEYLDDITVQSSTLERYLEDLRKVFLPLADANLTLRASKCNFCRQEIKFLWYLITPGGIKLDPGLVATIEQFSQPTNIEEVQAFLELSGYYRRFIQNYAKIAEPLLKLLLSAQHTASRSFSSPIIQAPNLSYPFILELDAYEHGIGCVLTPEYGNKKYVNASASRTLSSSEQKYSAVEREALAIAWATKHFR